MTGVVATEVVGEVDDEVLAALARLLPLVSSRAAPLTSRRLEAVVACPSTHVLVARLDGQIVGMALLLVLTTLTGRFGFVEEVAVDEAARGQRVARRLMEALLGLARTLELDFVELTSRPSREAANRLYHSLGFEIRHTNCFRKTLAR